MMNAAVIVLLLAAAAWAASGLGSVNSAAGNLCAGLVSLMPIAAMLMVALSGAVYAAGQVMGAETRARAATWAAACLGGAMMAVLISAIGPSVAGAIYPGIGCSAEGMAEQPIIQYTQPCTAPQGCICRDFGCLDAVCASGKSCTPCASPSAPPSAPARCM